MSLTVCITPLTLGYPEGAGHLWVYLNWALGLRALGCRLVWLEDLAGVLADRSREEVERQIATLRERLERFELGGSLALYSSSGATPDPELMHGCLDLEAATEADLLLDFAYDTPADAVARFARSAVVDLDPGLLQLWMSQGKLTVARHDRYFSIGETVGAPDARFPDCGVQWQYTPPPVHLPAWPPAPAPADAPYTTVTNWWEGWIELDDTPINNDKRTAFLAYAPLPERAPARLELALTIDDWTAATDGRLLEGHGWTVRDAWEVAETPERYRGYIQDSRGEFSCAKPSCRVLANAWISDRTLCYLASGKPAVVEHTGPSGFLPDAEGLFRFASLDQAVKAFEQIESDYDRHSRLARELAEEHFDAQKVVANLLERALA